MSLEVDRVLRLAPHIGLGELVDQGDADRASRWGLLTAERLVSLTQLAGVLERLRARIGGRPIRCTSGLRHPGASRSQHHEGQAADIQIDGLAPLQVIAELYAMAGELDVQLRQVIAESNRGADALARPMARGCGSWVHVAVIGPGYGPTAKAWLTSPDNGLTYLTWRPS